MVLFAVFISQTIGCLFFLLISQNWGEIKLDIGMLVVKANEAEKRIKKIRGYL